ncbi:MAG: hypothetical protein EAX95_09875 [Candidatus Thorarchaeota archaeon]|nr:hypothetical protein [Candidatus Thorarchaeota archaeon]
MEGQPKWQSDLAELLQFAKKIRDEMNTDCEKIQIALTGVLRLVGGEKTQILEGLGGRREDLQRYLLDLVSEMRQKSKGQLTQLCNDIEQLSETISKNEG